MPESDAVHQMSLEEKRELLAQLLKAEAAKDADQLSVAQRRYWVLRQMAPDVATHVVSTTELSGAVDTALLQQACAAVVRRRGDLSVGFVEVEGRPVRVHTSTAGWVPLSTVDLSDVAAGQQPEQLRQLVAEEAARPFDAASPPLVRLTLVRCSPRLYVLVLVAHQLVADDRSGQLLVDEIRRAYGTLAQDGGVPDSTPAPEFADFATWQRAWLGSEEGERQLQWWRGRLAEVPVLTLPTDRSRPTVKAQGLRGSRVATPVPAETWEGLKSLVIALGQPVPEIVLAGWAALLARYCGQRDFAIGWLTDGRQRAEWESMVGPCQQTWPVRCVLRGDPTFGDLLAGISSSVNDSRAHGAVPFERLVEDVPHRQDVAHSPLFQVRFAAERSAGEQRSGGVGWQPADIPTGLAPFDLTLRLRETPEGAALVLEFAGDLYDDATAERMLDHLLVLLKHITTQPGTRLGALPLAGETERAQITAWEQTAATTDSHRGLHELIEEQVARTPDAIALRGGGLRLTYAEMNRRANRLAHRLRRLGVGPERLVAVTADRRPESVIALLGVLKSGAAYVPLDPEYPAERVRYVCEDAAVAAVVITPGRSAQLSEGDWKVVVAETIGDGDEPDTNPEPLTDNQNLAYAIYTSGSSGRPKGVLVPHHAIINATQNRTGVFPEPISAYVMLAPLSFDASGAGLYWTLANGGRLVLPNEDEVRDPRLLAALLREEKGAHFDGVPSQYGVLLETQPDCVADLRCVILAGEALPPSVVARHFELAPNVPLFNEYGPTEGTVWSTVHRCEQADAGMTVPIGKPVRGVRVHVLDEAFGLAPIGVPGELCLAGEQVVRGYLNRAELTAERFVPDPYLPGGRMYRTGDLASWRPDGELEFLGRADSQVKVRGFRVELAEIETVLGEHPAVAATAVVVRQHGEAAQLIAYLAPRTGRTLDRAGVESFVRDRLPSYMLPQHYILLDTLPMTDRGKVDRAALPDPAPDLDRGVGYEEPRTKIEREVALAFAEALGIERVGRHQDFFANGGNSLLIARVGSRLSKAYGVDLPLHSLFTTPTVAGVATTIEVYRKEGYQGLLAKRDPQLLVAESRLDPEITPAGLPMANIADPDQVLVTGATGYLGIFLVEQLLLQTHAHVHCLVRADDPVSAQERLRETAAKFKVDWDERWDERVHPVVGDLAKPLLGVSEDEFDRLGRILDVIYHNGALVNFVYPYTVLKAPNVGGTVEVLRLACRTRAKLVHHVSTIDVLVGSYIPRPFLEIDLPPLPPRVPFSYPQSKWIAEKMVVTARERGLPTTIFRPSIMMGHTETGACHETDYILTALRGFLDLKILPVYTEILNSVTVDFASAALIAASLRPDSIGRIFHIWNTEALPTNETYEWIRSFGYDFDVVPFQEATDRAMRVDPSHPIYPLLPVLFLYTGGDAGLPMEFAAHLALDPASECRNLHEAIAGKGISCPPIDEKFLHNCLNFLLEKGFLPEPQRGGPR